MVTREQARHRCGDDDGDDDDDDGDGDDDDDGEDRSGDDAMELCYLLRLPTLCISYVILMPTFLLSPHSSRTNPTN